MLLVTLKQVIFPYFHWDWVLFNLFGYFLYEYLYIICMQYQDYNNRVLESLSVELHTVVRWTMNVGNQTWFPQKCNECFKYWAMCPYLQNISFVYNNFDIFQCTFDYHFHFNTIENLYKITQNKGDSLYHFT